MTYATREEVFALGLGAEAFASRSREIEAVDTASGVFTLSGHGLFAGALVRFMVRGAAVIGSPSAALPSGLSASLMYETTPASSDLFKVAPDGGAIITSFLDAGAGVFSLVVDPGPNIDRIAQNESANIDEDLTANLPPIGVNPITGRYDDILVGVCARRTAIRSALKLGLANPIYKGSLDALIKGQEEDTLRLKRWYEGRPINVRPADQTTILENAARAGCDALPALWTTGTL